MSDISLDVLSTLKNLMNFNWHLSCCGKICVAIETESLIFNNLRSMWAMLSGLIFQPNAFMVMQNKPELFFCLARR